MAKDRTARIKKAIQKRKVAKADKRRKGGMSLYSNLAYKRRVKRDLEARKRAEELAKLPKNPFLRFFARLRPDRVFKFIFSKEGQKKIWKFIAACVLIGIIAIGGLFLYYKKDLSAIDPVELANRVSNTVNTYLDRNGEVLWEDRGSGDYRLVVEGSDISTYMRQATVAIEDKNFYNHIGVDFTAIMRASFVTLTGGAVQGGSTLTQQLIKQVYFSDEAGDRGLTGVPRKIKEMILALEVEKMYDKEQIITLYLNESPYGGRRNGVESAARTYFNKSAKDLDLAESALLAAIPNNPAVLNPYNSAGNKSLVSRQHKVLNAMVDMGYITEAQRDEAKAVDILERIQPEENQYDNIRAPWFVLEVKSQLENKYGIKTMRGGGFTIKTTLDLRAQNIAEDAIRVGADSFRVNGSDNAALVSVDVETSQVIAMVGSHDWHAQGYGQVNATTSLLEPASSIKPILDYTPLFVERSGLNYGAGSLIADTNMDSIYCRGTYGKCSLRNANRKFHGNLTIRRALAGSLNVPAVRALYINGIENSLDIAHKLGDVSYCANGENAGLSMAIGGGCSVRPVEHANAYASLARGGVYKDLTYWLEVKNSSGDIIDSWSDSAGTRVVDEQAAYMTTDILADVDSRRFTFGGLAAAAGFYSRKVWFAAKTGTTENGMGKAKDSWIMTYSTVLSTAIWNGRHDGSALANDSHTVAFRISAAYIEAVHEQVYGADGKWKSGDRIEQPAGMQRLTVNGQTDIWPSWYNKSAATAANETIVFDSITKKRATECTPEETRVEVSVSKFVDPVTDTATYFAGGYDTENYDDVHQCTDKRPSGKVTVSPSGGPGEDSKTWTVTATAEFGTYELSTYELIVNGTTVKSGNLNASSDKIMYETESTPKSISFKIIDKAGYSYTAVGSAGS